MPRHKSPQKKKQQKIDDAQEDRIQLAVNELHRQLDERAKISIRATARVFRVPRETLRSRFNGRQHKKKAFSKLQAMAPPSEDVFAEWVKFWGSRGAPLTKRTLLTKAEQITGRTLGINWVDRFLKRHSDIKTRMASTLEKCRAGHLNRPAVESFFTLLKSEVEGFQIPPENIYNMDEKGVTCGDTYKAKMLFDRDQATAFIVGGSNKELTTVIECISADGDAMIPMIIFKGKRFHGAWYNKKEAIFKPS